MLNDEKTDRNIRGDTITIVPGTSFNFNERTRSTERATQERKLPPAPGRTPRSDKVPADEILPRK